MSLACLPRGVCVALVVNMLKSDGGGRVSSRTCFSSCGLVTAVIQGALSQQAFWAHQMRKGDGGELSHP